MFNPNPPVVPAATNDFWTPDEKYSTAVPFPVKEAAKLTPKQHRFFQHFDLGVMSGMGNNQQSVVPGLPVGASQTYNFDQIPDWYTIYVSSETAARIFVYIGPNNTGIPFRVNAGGVITIPSLNSPMITIVCRAATATAFGTIIGHAGYDNMIDTKFSYLAQ